MKQPHDCTFSFVRMLAKFLDSHHTELYVLDIIVTKYAEKKLCLYWKMVTMFCSQGSD